MSMPESDRTLKVLEILEKEYPRTSGTYLKFRKPLELLVATILSAQSTDEQVNRITPRLFERYRTAADYADADTEELEEIIRSSGFYHRKADLVKSAAKQIVEDFGGEVPGNMEDLLKLKGVARKTANIVLSNAFGVVEGIAVDTHVLRLSERLGFSAQKDRDKVEADLMRLYPHEKWHEINYLLIAHGRAVCDAKKPRCDLCKVNQMCPSAFKFKHFQNAKK